MLLNDEVNLESEIYFYNIILFDINIIGHMLNVNFFSSFFFSLFSFTLLVQKSFLYCVNEN